MEEEKIRKNVREGYAKIAHEKRPAAMSPLHVVRVPHAMKSSARKWDTPKKS